MKFYELKGVFNLRKPAELITELIEDFLFQRNNSVLFDTGQRRFTFLNVINIGVSMSQQEWRQLTSTNFSLSFAPGRSEITITIVMPPSDIVPAMVQHIEQTQRKFSMSMSWDERTTNAYGCILLNYIPMSERGVVLNIQPDYISQHNEQ